MNLNKKQIGLLSAAMIGVFSLGAVGSYAYFSDKTTVINDFSTGSLDLKVTESLWTNSIDGQNMYPGYTVAKNPTVQNITGMKDNNAYVEAYVRIKDAYGNEIHDEDRLNLIYHMIRYTESNNLMEGSKYSDNAITKNPNVNPAFKCVDADLKTGTWTYYLKDHLDSANTVDGGDSVTLFSNIVIPTEWSQTELDKVGDFQIEVEFKGIQEATFEDVDEAMSVLNGINAHINYEENDTNRGDVTPSDENVVDAPESGMENNHPDSSDSKDTHDDEGSTDSSNTSNNKDVDSNN